MESQPNSVTEKELVERVIELHRKGLGVRRISKTLKLEGNPRSKDQVWRIIKKHAHEASSETDVDQSKGFRHLKQKEKQLWRQLKRQRGKEACRTHIAKLTVELLMASYERRRKYFADKKKLFQLTETIMQARNPFLWDRFLEFCEHNSDPIIAVFTAVGKQEDFEEQLGNGPAESLDAYIERELEESLDAWTGPIEEEENDEDEEESSQHSELETKEWVDEQGYHHILIPHSTDDDDGYI